MPTIALIEDNPDNRLLVRAILEEHHEIQEFCTGLEALQGLEEPTPDLILLDISLPEMDGPEVLINLRKRPAYLDVPIIALTAHAMSGDREKFLAMGFTDYITKPIVDIASFQNIIRDLLHINDQRG